METKTSDFPVAVLKLEEKSVFPICFPLIARLLKTNLLTRLEH